MVSLGGRGHSTDHAIPLRFMSSRPHQVPIHGAAADPAKRRSKGVRECQ